MMLFEIKHRYSGKMLFSIETTSMKLAVEAAVKAKVSLQYANLRSANLQSADLRSANLQYADLQYADLRDADLQYADLRDADLRSADLRYSDLRDANIKYAWHVHHEKLWEVLTEPIKNRIAYIKENKPPAEQATRLRLLKLIKGPLPDKMTKAAMDALHKKECPDCPWNGSTIFP